MPVALTVAILQVLGGWFNTYYSKAVQEHGQAAIPSKEDILKMSEENQKIIDAGKI